MAIAGGGVGGLALALALQHRSINCVVYERDADASTRKAGYGLTMQQGANALRDLGLPNEGVFSVAKGHIKKRRLANIAADRKEEMNGIIADAFR